LKRKKNNKKVGLKMETPKDSRKKKRKNLPRARSGVLGHKWSWCVTLKSWLQIEIFLSSSSLMSLSLS